MENNKDVGMYEDLVFALKNLCAIESHAKSSFYLNGDKKFLEINDGIREIRTKWLDIIVKKENSEIWCITKHLLNSIIGLEEVANRLKDSKEGMEANKDAGILTGLLFELNEIKSGGEK